MLGFRQEKKAGMHFRACAEHTSGNDVTSGHVTSCYFIPVRTASGDVTSSNTCVMARSPLLPWGRNRARTLPSLIYFSWDIHRDPPPQFFFKYQSWYLTPCITDISA
jgi:hypothetical protein